jgi:hypothetical protein
MIPALHTAIADERQEKIESIADYSLLVSACARIMETKTISIALLRPYVSTSWSKTARSSSEKFSGTGVRAFIKVK